MKHGVTRARGFSLMELMVAITIGLIILAAVSTIFASAKRSYNEQDRQSKMQENARFALNFLMRDLRHAGYYGCVDEIDSDSVKSTINASADLFLNALFPIEGIDNKAAGSTWYPSGTTTLPTSMKDDTDALVLRMALSSDAVNLADPMPNTSAELKVDSVAGLTAGDVVMISDCSNADIFQLTAVQSGSLHLQHNTGTGTPGNSTKVFSKAYSPPTSVMKFVTRRYYIRNNGSGVPSLYRQDNTGGADELVEGVEQMQITYGKDTDSPTDDTPNIFLKAGEAGLQSAEDWARVRAVRIGLLVRTTSDKDHDTDNASWVVNGYTVPASDTNDNNRRRLYHVTVQMRNL